MVEAAEVELSKLLRTSGRLFMMALNDQKPTMPN